jgi:hypothetical protein
MIDDVGTSCATTNATPETSFAPRHGMDAPLGRTGNRSSVTAGLTHTDRMLTERAGALPLREVRPLQGRHKAGLCL